MNEQIRLLAEQAGMVIVDDEFSTYGKFAEKFAQLIVAECIRYVQYRTTDWDADLHWIFRDESGYMEVDIESLLREHWGVE